MAKRGKKKEDLKKEGPNKADLIIRREMIESKGKDPISCEVIDCVTPNDHAERILGYGKERATNLLKQHKSGCTWSHINWKIVEEGIVV